MVRDALSVYYSDETLDTDTEFVVIHSMFETGQHNLTLFDREKHYKQFCRKRGLL